MAEKNISKDKNLAPKTPKKVVRKKPGEMKQLDITSLVDILTILLVFLIKNVSVEAQRVTIPERLQLPTAVSVEELQDNDQAVVMRVFTDEIYVSDIPVGSPEAFMHDEEVRQNLTDYMLRQTEIITDRNPNLEPVILLQADRQVRCRYITELVSLIAHSKFTGVYFSSIRGDDPEIVYDL